MITRQQTEELAEYYQIDRFTIFREYLQLMFLNYLYQHRRSAKIYFKGGTAIHLLLDSPRFSEDLDFSTEYSSQEIGEIIGEVKKGLVRELAGVKILLLHEGRKSIRFRLKYIVDDFKYPLVIRLDFTQEEGPVKILTSPLVTRFPLRLFPVVSHYAAKEILAEKIRAFLKRAKGRDVFDLWFLLEKGIEIDRRLVDKKLKEIGQKFDEDKLIKKINDFPLKKLKLDLNQFLPRPQRRIVGTLKERLLEKLS